MGQDKEEQHKKDHKCLAQHDSDKNKKYNK